MRVPEDKKSGYICGAGIPGSMERPSRLCKFCLFALLPAGRNRLCLRAGTDSACGLGQVLPAGRDELHEYLRTRSLCISTKPASPGVWKDRPAPASFVFFALLPGGPKQALPAGRNRLCLRTETGSACGPEQALPAGRNRLCLQLIALGFDERTRIRYNKKGKPRGRSGRPAAAGVKLKKKR